MIRKLIIASMLLTLGVNAQTLLVTTNIRSAVSGGPAYTLSGQAGTFRFTYIVESTAGVPIPLDDGTTFRLEVWASDNHRVINQTNTTAAEVSLALGQVKFTPTTSLQAGTYRVRGIATPVNGDTNQSWNITHHWLVLTNAASASASIIVSNQIFLAGSTNIENQTVYLGGATNFVGLGGITGGVTNDTITVNGSGVSGGGGASVFGVNAPYVVSPLTSVTLSTQYIWQSYSPTGTTTITLPTKGSATDSGDIRLDLIHGGRTITINADESENLRFYTNETLILWFNSSVGSTNWTVRQERQPLNIPFTTRGLRVIWRPSKTLDSTAWYGPSKLDGHLIPSGVTITTNGWVWPSGGTATNNIAMTQADEIEPMGDSYTLTAWINCTATGGVSIGNNLPSGTDDRWGVSYGLATVGRFFPVLNANGGPVLSSEFTTNFYNTGWKHIGITINRTTGTSAGYVDGVQLTSAYNAAIQQGASIRSYRQSGVTIPVNKFRIGNYSPTSASASNATVDCVAVWKTALTSNEIVEVFNAGRNW